jgi:hypothetical protein
MTELLKKGVKFVWSEKCEEAFHTLRQHLTSAPVLAQSDTSLFKVLALVVYYSRSIVMLRVLTLVVYSCKTIRSLPMPHGHYDLMR